MSIFTIYCTSSFEYKFNDLKKKYKNYGSLGKDLFNFFDGQTLESVFEQKQIIDNKAPKYRLIKCRIVNSGSKFSERSGFRLYYNVIFEQSIINLLYVYPKTGPYAQESLDIDFIKLQTKLFIKEKDQAILKRITLNKKLKSIEFE